MPYRRSSSATGAAGRRRAGRRPRRRGPRSRRSPRRRAAPRTAARAGLRPRPARRRGRRAAARRAAARPRGEGAGQRVDRRVRDEDVPLRREARPATPPAHSRHSRRCGSRCRRGRRPRRAAGASRPSSAAVSRPATSCAPSPARSSASPSGPYRGLAYACVAIAPTSGSAHGTTEPTARNFDCVATPHCPLSRSQAAIEYVATIKSSIEPPGSSALDDRAGRLARELVRRARQERERAPVARHAARVAEQLERDRGLARAHREPVADRQHRDVGRVDARDQGHVAEDARVAGEVDRLAVLEPHDDPAGLAGVALAVGARRVERVDEREPDPVDLAASRPCCSRARRRVRRPARGASSSAPPARPPRRRGTPS